MQPTPSDRFWANVTHAATMHRRRLLKRVETGTASSGQREMFSDLDFFLDAIADGRVTILPKRE